MSVAEVQGKTLADHLASKSEGEAIESEQWAMLTAKERERVTLDLEALGLILLPRGFGFRVADAESQRGPVMVHAIYPEYEFIANGFDHRIPGGDDIWVRVANCSSEHQAAAKLKGWLDALAKLGTDVHAEGESVGGSEVEAAPFEVAA